MRGKLICQSIWLAVAVLASAHGSLQAMAPASSTNINFDADIVRSTCRVDGLAGWLSLGNLLLADIGTNGVGTFFSIPGGQDKIKIMCDGLKKAKISFSAQSEKCPQSTLGGWQFSCGGPNLTIGMMPKVGFLKEGGGEQIVNLKKDLDNGEVHDIKVDNGESIVTIKGVYLARLKETPSEYGVVTASFGIRIISD